MSETSNPIPEAVATLIPAGYMVEEFVEDPSLWRVNGEVMTSAELLDEATRMGLMDG
jgi:hypothetical protein